MIGIIGAGACGLYAAYELAKKGIEATILEALPVAGGRTRCVTYANQLIEFGAEFIHGDLPLTHQLVKDSGAKKIIFKGSIYEHEGSSIQQSSDFIEGEDEVIEALKQLQEDCSVAEALKGKITDEKYFETVRYVEGYYAGDPFKASALALLEELNSEWEDQYHIEGGYSGLLHFIETYLQKTNTVIHYNTTVHRVRWQTGGCTVQTDNGDFQFKKMFITVPVGVLQKGLISFQPQLPQLNEVSKLGFGNVIKIILSFRTSFWEHSPYKLTDLMFLFSQEEIPTWWPRKEGMMIGWLGGPSTKKLESLSEDMLVQTGLDSLQKIFTDINVREHFLFGRAMDWSKELLASGAYSYDAIDSKRIKKEIRKPVSETIYFGGEGLYEGEAIGTVEAAFAVAKEFVDSLSMV